ncbi:MAG: hypothetical protein EBY37_05050 [Flavobacteriia bacterium]|nr:hypothetical protein [Flavobacteriia bacterium]
MNEDMKPCPRCDSPYGYALGQSRYACPECYLKNIHLTEGDHNISCKIDGFGALALKSIYVKKG